MKKILLLFIILSGCVSFISCNDLIEKSFDGIDKHYDEMATDVSQEDNHKATDVAQEASHKTDKNIINNKENNSSGNYFKYCGEQKISNTTVAVYEDKKSVIYVVIYNNGHPLISSIKIRGDYKPDKIDKSNTYFRYSGQQTIANSDTIVVYEDIYHGTMVYLTFDSTNITSISTNYS